MPSFRASERGVIPGLALTREELDLPFRHADAAREVAARGDELRPEYEVVLRRDSAERPRLFADEGLLARLVDDVNLPVNLERDAIAGRDDIHVRHARLRASEAAIAPLDRPHRVQRNVLARDLEVCRERLDCEQRRAALGVGQRLGRLLARDEADILAAGCEGRQRRGNRNCNSRHLSLRVNS